MKPHVVLVPCLGLLTATRAVPASAEYPPERIAFYEAEGGVSALAAGGPGYVYFADGYGVHLVVPRIGEAASWLEPVCYAFGVAADADHVYVSDGAIGEGCSNENLFEFTPAGELVAAWCPSNWVPGGEVECYATFICLGPDGTLFAAAHESIRKFDAGRRLLQIREGGDTGPDFGAMAVGPDGFLYVVERKAGEILRLDPDLRDAGVFLPHGTGPGTVTAPAGLAFDRAGNAYILDRGRNRIVKLDPQGREVVGWEVLGLTGAAVVDPSGYLYVGSGSGVIQFDNKPGDPPPEPVAPHPAAIVLHVGRVTGRGEECGSVPREPAEVITLGDAEASEGTRYFVYILASPSTVDGPLAGITGLQLGLEYAALSGNPEEAPDVFSWTPCSVLDFPQDGWPASGTGNTITWTVNPSACQLRELVLAGFLQVSAYGRSVMSATAYPVSDPGHPGWGLAKVADCDGAEIVIPESRRGWVAFGRGSPEEELAGCNPLYADCTQVFTRTRGTTWGRIKTLFR